MKKTVEEHAERFSEKAAAYDDSKSEEYHACASLVIDHAAPEVDDVVLDLGAGTGAIALPVAEDAERVLARDISEGMMEEGRRKAEERGLDNVEFAYGEFRDPGLDPDQRVDVVTSNFALHHLADDEKREAIGVMADTGTRRIVLGDVAFFEEPDPEAPFYSPEVDDPATVGTLVEAFTDEGFAVTAVERVHDQVAVIVAERIRELPA
ncbi:class I SAM-dependent methyltransferase [Halorubrum sp. E3]|uniref:Methyltransferase type 11 n=2 Tax=Halorubrum distributum TaxID=29283 RepID=M0P284_9EURY|nr:MULTISPECIES: class I SAM-dependent methyltransferase [Halorubrum distributum group]EMA63948.1 methyltransferase type 11 [Halorubrum litoreum JCM 13561]MYL67166.1 methyltransferase domain-containing protein [Halorubrum terrestre]OYR80918.1 class I SAM-dependent methyltransferase [Halorubrum sp. E3]